MFSEKGECSHCSFIILFVNEEIAQFLQSLLSFGNGHTIIFIPRSDSLIGLPGNLVAPKPFANVRVKTEDRRASGNGSQCMCQQIEALLQPTFAKESRSLFH